ncbi:MAG TPA: ATP-binding protein [Bacteroidia bacterium]|nr:ATP-binding protein [Bacteroidia bacterium]
MIKGNFRYFLLIVSLALVFSAIALEWNMHKRDLDFIRITVFAKKTLHEEENRANKYVEWLGNMLSRQTSYAAIDDSLLLTSQKPVSAFYSFVYLNDSLIYWDNNAVSFAYNQVKNGINQQLIQLKNGWYELFRYQRRNITIIGLLPIRAGYDFQNKYLRNEFNPVLGIPEHALLLPSPATGSYPVISSDGNYLFSIKYNPIMSDPGRLWYIAALYLAGFFLLLISFYLYARQWLLKNPLVSFIIISLLVFIKWLMLTFRFPEFLYGMPLFNPKFYATSYFLNSLGDFLLSASVFCCVILFVYNYLHLRRRKIRVIRQSPTLLSIVVIGNLLFTFLFSVFINYLISGLILNSKISFNVNNVFELTFFSLIGFLIIGILLFSFYVSCEGTVKFAEYSGFSLPYNFLLFLITQGLFLVVLILFRNTEVFINYGVATFLLTNSLILFISYIRFTSRQNFSFVRYMFVIAGFSVYAAYTISSFNMVREKNNMRLLVSKVENREDLIAEYLFQEIDQKLKTDPVIISNITQGRTPLLEEKIKKRITLNAFNQAYWTRYDIQIKAFDSAGVSLFANSDTLRNVTFYDSIINTQTRPTYSHSFNYLSTNSGKIGYIGKITYPKNVGGELAGTIIIQLDSKFNQEEGGFPDLLLSEKMPASRDLSKYAYAKYENGKLIFQSGKFNYFHSAATYDRMFGLIKSDQFVTLGGFIHLFYNQDKNNLIVISYKTPQAIEQVTLFSYVFIFFSATFILIYMIWLFLANNFRLHLDFRKRIQISVIGLVVIAILLIGGGSIFYISRGYSEEQKVRIKEKLSTLMLAVESEFNDKNLTEANLTEETTLNFSRISNTLSSDFNLYDKNGRLIYSTQPKIFDKEIISRLMNRSAFDQLKNYQANGFIHDEKIGLLEYTSAYETIMNKDNKVAAYINLPYFARQNELKKEISGFLVTLINIYVLLFGIAIVITFIISNRLVKPLNLIQQKLARVKLDSSNDLLEWEGGDEIGSLVNEYNKMVNKLAKSADALAQSERETAWREMAKQVAHEIKNPLTPMKLSMQHLARAWKEKNSNFENIFEKVSRTMIEQIDSLSRIATEFSNFAKMPKGNFEKIDLIKSIQSNIDLYSEVRNVDFEFNKSNIDAEAIVNGDWEQTLRAFGNLIKNAVQAIPENQQGLITIHLTKEHKQFYISITDNGKGITEEAKQKIFTPNFTTKSGGTGLGLAMVKSIVENMQGKISFESEYGKGTTFKIELSEAE